MGRPHLFTGPSAVYDARNRTVTREVSWPELSTGDGSAPGLLVQFGSVSPARLDATIPTVDIYRVDERCGINVRVDLCHVQMPNHPVGTSVEDVLAALHDCIADHKQRAIDTNNVQAYAALEAVAESLVAKENK